MMKQAVETQAFVKSDAGKGTILFSFGFLIFYFAIKYLVYFSGLVAEPAPGTLLHGIFDSIFLVH
jgi:hypothetical protein